MLKSTIVIELLISKNRNGYDIPFQLSPTVCWDILPFGLSWTGCSGCWEHSTAVGINCILPCLVIEEWASSWSFTAPWRENECFWPSEGSNSCHTADPACSSWWWSAVTCLPAASDTCTEQDALLFCDVTYWGLPGTVLMPDHFRILRCSS